MYDDVIWQIDETSHSVVAWCWGTAETSTAKMMIWAAKELVREIVNPPIVRPSFVPIGRTSHRYHNLYS